MSAGNPVTITPTGAIDRLSDTLAQFRSVSGRSAERVLFDKGTQILQGNNDSKYGAGFKGLYGMFRRQRPEDGAIYRSAKLRGFRGAVSERALNRAREMMGGYKSILVNTSTDDAGRVKIGFVRAGVQKKVKRVHYRWGRKSFAVSGRGFYEGGAGIQRNPDDKVVNLRAVAKWFELRQRESARGFLAAGWLQKRWREFAMVGNVPVGTPGLAPGRGPSKQFGGVRRVLQNVNPRSKVSLLGDAEFSGGQDSGNVSLRITSYVPGTLAVGEKRSLFAQVINSVTADVETYLARKQVETLSEALGLRFSA